MSLNKNVLNKFREGVQKYKFVWKLTLLSLDAGVAILIYRESCSKSLIFTLKAKIEDWWDLTKTVDVFKDVYYE